MYSQSPCHLLLLCTCSSFGFCNKCLCFGKGLSALCPTSTCKACTCRFSASFCYSSWFYGVSNPSLHLQIYHTLLHWQSCNAHVPGRSSVRIGFLRCKGLVRAFFWFTCTIKEPIPNPIMWLILTHFRTG